MMWKNRRFLLPVLGFLVAFVIGLAVIRLDRDESAPPEVQTPPPDADDTGHRAASTPAPAGASSGTEPASGDRTPLVDPRADATPTDTTSTGAPPVAPQETPPVAPPVSPAEAAASATPPPEASPLLPPLATVIVKDHPVNTIPSEPEAEKPVGDPRLGVPAGNGRSIGQSAEVAFGPRRDPATPIAPRQFSDKTSVTGATTLTVGTTPVRLFGIAALKPTDRCGSLPGDSDCLAAAKAALLRKIGPNGAVSCHTPNPRPGLVVVAAICLDPQGTDLGGFLIAEGLALADTTQSYDYVGAENVARTLKRGTWQYH